MIEKLFGKKTADIIMQAIFIGSVVGLVILMIQACEPVEYQNYYIWEQIGG